MKYAKKNLYFYSYFLNELFFILGSISFGRKGINLKNTYINLCTKKEFNFIVFNNLLTAIFILSSLLYIFNIEQLPIFSQESRLIIFQRLGLLTWILDVVWIALPISIIIKRNILNLRSNFDYILILLALFFVITKGGKTDILFIIYSFFIYSVIFRDDKVNKLLNYFVILIPVTAIFSTFIILNVWENDTPLFSYIYNRILTTGDSLFMGYVSDYLQSIRSVDIVEYFFGGIRERLLGLYGINVPERFIFGFNLWGYYYPDSFGVGPNARTNIIGFIMFGPYLSAIFAYIVGFLFSLSRSYIKFYKDPTITNLIIYCLISVYSLYFFIDPSLAVAYIIKIIIVITPIAFVASIRIRK